MRYYLLILLLVAPSFVHAQRRWQPPHPGHHPHQFHERKLYKPHSVPNILTVNLGAGGMGGEIAVTAGFEYERYLDKRGIVSVSLPVIGYNGGHLLGEWDEGDTYTNLYGVLFVPGIFFHPFGNGRAADFSFGPAFPFGTGSVKITHVDGTINPHTITNHSYSGILGRANINFYPREGTVFGMFFEIGGLFPTINNHNAFGQFGIRFGGRF